VKHARGINGSAGLSQNQFVDRDDGIRTQNQGSRRRSDGHVQSFSARQASRVLIGRLPGQRIAFIDTAGGNFKIEPGVL